MGNIRMSLDSVELTTIMNRAKEVYVENMLKEGIIDNTQANQMLKNSIVFSDKKMLGGLLGKIISPKEKQESYAISIVKVLNSPEKDVLPNKDF